MDDPCITETIRAGAQRKSGDPSGRNNLFTFYFQSKSTTTTTSFKAVVNQPIIVSNREEKEID